MASRKTNFLCTLVTGCQHIHSSPRLMSTGHLRGGGGGEGVRQWTLEQGRFINGCYVPVILDLTSEYVMYKCSRKQKGSTGKSRYADFAREQLEESIIRSMKFLPSFWKELIVSIPLTLSHQCMSVFLLECSDFWSSRIVLQVNVKNGGRGWGALGWVVWS